MKKIILALTTLSLLSLVACGGGGSGGKVAVTPRKVDTTNKVTKSAGGGLKAKEGEEPATTKKGG
ncbi:MAG: hypothetical protein K8R92_03965 [Planctomycetes bacterium]|nr:hypothetical protein [Planctomycetota bacterium]